MTAFTPAFCPHPSCAGQARFAFQHKGHYWRRCDNLQWELSLWICAQNNPPHNFVK